MYGVLFKDKTTTILIKYVRKLIKEINNDKNQYDRQIRCLSM